MSVSLNTVNSENDDHRVDTNNPHGVTASQVGAYTKSQVDSMVGGGGGYVTSSGVPVTSTMGNWSFNVSTYSSNATWGVFFLISSESAFPGQAVWAFPNSSYINGWQVFSNYSDKSQSISSNFLAPVVNGTCYGKSADSSSGGTLNIWFVGWL